MSLQQTRTHQRWLTDALIAAAWAPLVVFMSNEVFSHVFDLYARWPSLDIPMHIVGGIAIAFFFRQLVLHASAAGILQANGWARAIIVFALVSTAAVFWEFAEFLAERCLYAQAQGDLADALGDMAIGMSGGVGYLAFVSLAEIALVACLKPVESDLADGEPGG